MNCIGIGMLMIIIKPWLVQTGKQVTVLLIEIVDCCIDYEWQRWFRPSKHRLEIDEPVRIRQSSKDDTESIHPTCQTSIRAFDCLGQFESSGQSAQVISFKSEVCQALFVIIRIQLKPGAIWVVDRITKLRNIPQIQQIVVICSSCKLQQEIICGRGHLAQLRHLVADSETQFRPLLTCTRNGYVYVRVRVRGWARNLPIVKCQSANRPCRRCWGGVDISRQNFAHSIAPCSNDVELRIWAESVISPLSNGRNWF